MHPSKTCWFDAFDACPHRNLICNVPAPSWQDTGAVMLMPALISACSPPLSLYLLLAGKKDTKMGLCHPGILQFAANWVS